MHAAEIQATYIQATWLVRTSLQIHVAGIQATCIQAALLLWTSFKLELILLEFKRLAFKQFD
jgi:hypothetical protein